MPAVSKYALVFKNRLLSLDENIELADVICRANNKSDFLNDEELLFKYMNPSDHKALATRSNTKTSKRIVVQHLRNSIYISYIKEVYEELSLYLKSLVKQAALVSKDKTSAYRLLGEQKITIQAKDILLYNDFEELIQFISEQIVQDLENERSTKALLSKICTKTNIVVEQKLIDEALPYLEIRHKFVHTDGCVDDDFKIRFPMFTYDKDNYIVLSKSSLQTAKNKITKLILAIDNDAIKKGILTPNT